MNIIIHGCNGKMGKTVVSVAAADPEINIVAGIDRYPDGTQNSFPVYSQLEDVKERADVIIDFSVAAALPDLLNYAVSTKTPLVIATTGLSQQDMELIYQSSGEIAIFRSANMSIGVNLMYELVKKAASVLGDAFDIEIIEKHHNQKIDSPSGTAYAIADAINSAFLNSMHYIFGRHSKNDKRTKNEIGIHAIRGGTIAGEHTVIFAGDNEILEITHSAQSRQIFAVGALAAAKYIKDKSPGLYDMHDVMLKEAAVTNIHIDNNQTLISISHLPHSASSLSGIFARLAAKGINVDMISQPAPVNGYIVLSFTIPNKELSRATAILDQFNSDYPGSGVDIINEVTKLTVEGLGMERQHGIAAAVFEILADQGIGIKLITTSETKLSLIIDRKDEKAAAEAIIDYFKL